MEDVCGYKKGLLHCCVCMLLPLVTSWICVVSPVGPHGPGGNYFSRYVSWISASYFSCWVPWFCTSGRGLALRTLLLAIASMFGSMLREAVYWLYDISLFFIEMTSLFV